MWMVQNARLQSPATARHHTISTQLGFSESRFKVEHTSIAVLSNILQSSRSAVPPFSTMRPPPCELWSSSEMDHSCLYFRSRNTTAPPVMFSPTSLTTAPGKMVMTRLVPLASSTTPPATSASIVKLRLMHSADQIGWFDSPVHTVPQPIWSVSSS
eukprot:scaffold21612_cov69-Phaeocystis_antarctica.AAC.2